MAHHLVAPAAKAGFVWGSPPDDSWLTCTAMRSLPRYRVVMENAGRHALAASSDDTIARVAGDRLSV
jgi:hypothetical protein